MSARSSRGVSGWSGRGGEARNPYALDRNPSGSSGGSGIAAVPPAEALRAATVNSAALLGMENRLGCLKAGSFADIVAVEGNPIDDTNVVIQKIRWVMKAGAVVLDKTKGTLQ